MVKELDAGLRSLCEVIKKIWGSTFPNAGRRRRGRDGRVHGRVFRRAAADGDPDVLDTEGFDTLAAEPTWLYG
jgi:hypothetical protein